MTEHRKERDATNASTEGYNIGSVRQLATRVGAREGRKEPGTAKGRILRRRIKDEGKQPSGGKMSHQNQKEPQHNPTKLA